MKLKKKKALKKLNKTKLEVYKAKIQTKFAKYIYRIDSLLAKSIKKKVSKKRNPGELV